MGWAFPSGPPPGTWRICGAPGSSTAAGMDCGRTTGWRSCPITSCRRSSPRSHIAQDTSKRSREIASASKKRRAAAAWLKRAALNWRVAARQRPVSQGEAGNHGNRPLVHRVDAFDVRGLDRFTGPPPREPTPDVARLRDALNQRAEQWKAELRAEPRVARLLLRRLVGPLTLWDASEPDAAWVEWETIVTPALLEGLAPIQVVASLMPASWNQIIAWLRQIEAFRQAA